MCVLWIVQYEHLITPYLVLSNRPQTVIIALSMKPVLLSLWRLKETITALWSSCTPLGRLRFVGGLKSSSKLSTSRFLCRWTHRCPEGAGAVGGHGGRVVGGRTVHQQRRARADGSGLQDWQEDPAERAHQAAFPLYVFVKTPRHIWCKSVNKVQRLICLMGVRGFLSPRFLLPHEFLRDDNCESCEKLAGLFALLVRLTGTNPRKKTPPNSVNPCLHVAIKTLDAEVLILVLSFETLKWCDFDILSMSDGSMSG